MDIPTLKSTALAMVAEGKGILAADESSKTIQKRFDKIGLTSTPDTNLEYRKMPQITQTCLPTHQPQWQAGLHTLLSQINFASKICVNLRQKNRDAK